MRNNFLLVWKDNDLGIFTIRSFSAENFQACSITSNHCIYSIFAFNYSVIKGSGKYIRKRKNKQNVSIKFIHINLITVFVSLTAKVQMSRLPTSVILEYYMCIHIIRLICLPCCLSNPATFLFHFICKVRKTRPK